MRWQNLEVEREEGARLPGHKEPATVRTFDAPEAMGIRFYEVLARSGINEVPKRSRMPFRFTINPYRGCTHACTYCLDGDTRILVRDGRTKALAELRPGDSIYGTLRWGRYRRYVETEVLDQWSTVKRAHRVTLEDGTELVASGDHRFLSNRGWKYVTGSEQGRGRRPHLTLNNKLIGTGGYVDPPAETAAYQRGYLCGLIRGDGHVGSYSYDRPGRRSGAVHRFRLALVDLEALQRARSYLSRLGVETNEFLYAAGGAIGTGPRPIGAIRTSTRAGVEAVRETIGWPRQVSDDWCKGFLAGIFDAEGSCGYEALRISNTDPAIIDWITWCMRRLGFDYAAEDSGRSNGLRCVRLLGGLREKLRFFHTTDPGITRKRGIEGVALKSDAKLGVASIEPLGKRELFDITTGTGDFIANGVVSHNCFARPTHTYLDFNAREDFEREIVVKVNVPELVRAELGRKSWKRQHVALGTNTDPYQWVEGRYELMPGIWEAMRDFSNPCSVLTKSPLLLRDIELMKEINERTEFSASLSVPTLEEKAWRETEPHTPHPRKRLEAVAELRRAGIASSVLIGPIIPGVNDSPDQIGEILRLAGEADASNVIGIPLHLRGEVKEIWFDWLREHRPDLIPHYEELYERGAYMKKAESQRLSGMVSYRKRTPGPRHRGSRKPPEKPPQPEPAAADQASLF